MTTLQRTADLLRVVGHDVDRVDWREKVSGSGSFVADVVLPGMLEGRVLRSPYPHARIRRIDTTRARAVPGVVAVLTGEDTPKRKWGEFRMDIYPLAVDKVRYVGEEVVAVAAVSAEAAEEALRLVEVEYEELPAVFDPLEAMQPGAPMVHEDVEGNIVNSFTVERGDPDTALARADLVIEQDFRTRVQWHASLEPTGAVAQPGRRGTLMVWANTNGVFGVRGHIARVLGIPVSDVRVIQTLVGGSFGGRGHDNNALVCALLAHYSHRPVRLINAREEDFLATRPREPMLLHMRMGFLRDGTISGKTVRVVADNGAYANLGPSVARVAALRHDHMFLNRDIRSELQVVYTNNTPHGAFRGFGNPSGQWAMQQMVDIGARALGLDTREVLLKNLVEANHTSPHGARILSCEVKACVEQVTEMIRWDERHATRKPNHGFGLAASCMVSGRRSHGDFDGSSAEIEIDLDGSVLVRSGEGETGPGTTTVIAQVVAEELGVNYADVSVSEADTATTGYAFGAHGSRATYIAGNAAREAAKRVREEVLRVAGELLEAAPQDLQIDNGVVSVKGAPGEQRSLTLGEVATRGLFRRNGQPIRATGAWDPPSDQSNKQLYGNESGAYNFCAMAVEVEVDPLTGQFSVLDVTMASDAGTVVHPVACAGQNEGALAQGLGYAHIEDLQVEDGRPLNPNFSDYRLPSIADMPPFRQLFVPSYEPTGPFGAKGIAQVGLDPVAPAIANAIYDAVGVRVTSLPITPEKVFWALRDKERAGRNGRDDVGGAS